jgi:hypothetical protein
MTLEGLDRQHAAISASASGAPDWYREAPVQAEDWLDAMIRKHRWMRQA